MRTIRRTAELISLWGVPLACVLALLALAANRMPIGRMANDLAYDISSSLDRRLALAPSQVLLVYTDPELDQHPEAYLALLQRLRELGASGFGIPLLDVQAWSDAQLAQLKRFDTATVGVVRSGEQRFPRQIIRSQITLCQPADGVYRSYAGPDPSGAGDPLAVVLAQKCAPTERPIPAGGFRIRFRGGADSLPHVRARAVLAGEVTAALVRDRTVLIGPSAQELFPGLTTPTTAQQPMSVLEYHGHALNSLRHRQAIRVLDDRRLVAVYFVMALAFMAATRRCRLHRVLALLVMAGLLQATVQAVVLRWANLWTPLASLMSVQVLAVAWCFDRRLRFSEDAWQRLRRRAFNVSSRYRDHPLLDPATEPWTHILSLFAQLFPLGRAALLVCRNGNPRLDLVARHRATPDEIREKRRDIRRPPFAEAVDRQMPILLDPERQFFQAAEGQSQFLAPLVRAGNVQGLIALELSQADLEKLPGFSRQLAAVCEEVASWVANYDQLSLHATQQAHWSNRLGKSPEEQTFNTLRRHQQSVERRLGQAYDLIEGELSGTAIFDLGGSVVMLNATMFRILHALGITSADVQLLHVLRTLTKREAAECHELLRRVIVHGHRERIVVSAEHLPQPIVVILQPFARSAQATSAVEEMYAFGAQGVQIEMFEDELLGDTHAVCQHATKQGLAIADQSLAEIQSLCCQLSRHDSQRALNQLQSTVKRARRTISNCQALLTGGQSAELDICVPVAPRTVVSTALMEVRPLADHRLISLSTSVPPELPDVAANPHRLRELLTTVVETMIQHSRKHSQIQVVANADQDGVTVTIESKGCGVAFDWLADLNRNGHDGSQSVVARLAQVRDWLHAWGGELTVASRLGEGAAVQIVLPRFHWHSTTATHPDPLRDQYPALETAHTGGPPRPTTS